LVLVPPAGGMQEANVESPLLVRGKLISMELESNEAWRAKYQARFELQLVNVSGRNVIVVRRDPVRVSFTSPKWTPQGELIFEAEEAIGSSQRRSSLDHAVPPAAFAAVLKPGEALTTSAVLPLEFYRSTRAEPLDTPFYPKSGRAELELTLRPWPLEAFDDSADKDSRLYGDELVQELRNKWAATGDLYLDEIVAEPIEIPLPPPPVAPKESGLVLRGHVSSIRLSEETTTEISFVADLDLEFANSGDRPVIVLRPDALQGYVGWERYWQGAVVVADSPEAMRAHNYVHADGAWPSNYRNQAWEQFQSAIDQPQPPARLFWVILPGEARGYHTTTALRFDKKHGLGYPEHGRVWSEISELPTLWLEVTLEIWPFNVEPKVSPGNTEFGRGLRQRWASAGVLELGEDCSIATEPMALVLPKQAQGK
jgi:hypothetical protein